MAAVADKRMGVDEIFSYADDLLPLIDGSEYGEAVAQADAVARMLQSVCVSEFNNLELQMKEHQEKIRCCKEKIEKAKSETVSDDELKELRGKMEEKLQEEKQLCQDLR
ncbi:hypothetical protein QOZ80_4AG0316120 [Eleusine coracana subsp. coracana]|nr:hypothetical protein QOZ80_4AG0316120 [Eleusine coracana subsp. coracana]